LAIARGGTGATSAADARSNLDVPSNTGAGASGTWNISVVGPVENAQFAGFLVERYQFPTSSFQQTTWSYDFLIGTRPATINRPGCEGFYLRAQPLDFFVFTAQPTFQTWSVTKLAYINALANQSYQRWTVTSNPGDFWPNTYVFFLYRIVNPIID